MLQKFTITKEISENSVILSKFERRETMADDMKIGAVGTQKVDFNKWKKLTPQEIIKEQGKGEEIPPEILVWAQQMAAFSKIPDDVTYEQVDGDVGIDALNKLGIEDEDILAPEAENAEKPTKTEEPGAVKDPDKVEEEQETDEGEFVESETAVETEDNEVEEEQKENDEFTLADEDLTTNNNEILKRKERKGRL